MDYYIFNTETEVKDKSAAIYDLYAPPRSERFTLYAYSMFTNGSEFAMEYDGAFDSQGLLDGLTPLTEQEAINQGFDLDNPII